MNECHSKDCNFQFNGWCGMSRTKPCTDQVHNPEPNESPSSPVLRPAADTASEGGCSFCDNGDIGGEICNICGGHGWSIKA